MDNLTSRRVLAAIDTADFSDCVSTGYRYTLYADGRVAAQYHSRWQGDRDGVRYSTTPDAVNVDDVDDAEALLTAWIDGEDPAEDCEYGVGRTWRITHRGWTVR